MRTKLFFSIALWILGFTLLKSQGTWSQKTNFGGTARSGAVGFSINGKGYILTGSDGTYKNDLWEYDPSTNAWTQRANFPGTARAYATGFSIGAKGYIGTGYDFIGPCTQDFWEYDPSNNTWTPKANFPGAPREWAVGFSIGTKGYIGTGGDQTGNNFFNDFYEYDPSIDTWTQKANFGGTARFRAIGFSIGAKGYIGTGYDATFNYKQDFWEYNPATNTWLQKANLGGNPRQYGVGFSIGAKGYVGTGSYCCAMTYYNDFWEYSPANNSWTQQASFTGGTRERAVGFSIGSKGYIGTGLDASSNFKQDFWEFAPSIPPIATFSVSNDSICAGECINFIDQSSNMPNSWNWSFPSGTPTTSSAQNQTTCFNTVGNYTVTLIVSNSAGSDTVTHLISVGSCVGIGENSAHNLTPNIYPNPTVENTTFQFSEQDVVRTILIYDQVGREVWRKQTQESTVELSTESFAPGLYYYIINEPGQPEIQGKIIIE